MAKHGKHIKFEIESASGTLTDITSYVSAVNIQPAPPSLWQRIKDWWFRRKLKRALKKLKDGVTVEINLEMGDGTAISKRIPYQDYYDWLHRN